ncbi:MAG: hypothetical protein WBL88_15945, partial [Nitrososphaeraceae archaeon]
MYNTSLPETAKLLKAGARVCKVGSLMFLLLGPVNYQICPQGVKRIGCKFDFAYIIERLQLYSTLYSVDQILFDVLC